jgi:hypothetical protein
MGLASYRAWVSDLVRDKDQVVSSASVDAAIEQGVLRYSEHFPREVSVVQPALAGQLQDLPAGWQPLFSRMTQVEFPAGLMIVPLGEVRFRNTPGGLQLELPEPADSGVPLGITYTQRHLVADNDDTIQETHRFAVACWAASIVCGQLASYYASEGAPTIGADVSDHQGKTERYRARARDLAKQFTDVLGVGDRRITAAGAAVNMRGTDSRGGSRLFHDRRYRR